MSDNLSPYLPPEIEHIIFVLAYHNDHRRGRKMILVAKRVYEWLIPHIFAIIHIAEFHHSPIRITTNEPLYRKHAQHVHHLLVGRLNALQVRKYLALFPNVVSILFNDYYPTYLPFLLKLPLTHLSVPFSGDLIPVYAKVTHLSLTRSVPWTLAKTGMYLPNLTHLGVEMFTREVVEYLLDKERSPVLRVVVISSEPPIVGVDNPVVLNMVDEPMVEDDRIVMVYRQVEEDWERGARGGVDMWKFAERVLEERALRGENRT